MMQSSGMTRANLQVDGVDWMKVNNYVYLSQEVNVRHNFQTVIVRQSAAGWQQTL